MLRLCDCHERKPLLSGICFGLYCGWILLPSTVCYLPCAGRSSRGKASRLEVSPDKINHPTRLQPRWVSDGGRQAAPTSRERQAGAGAAAREDFQGTARPSGDPSAWSSESQPPGKQIFDKSPSPKSSADSPQRSTPHNGEGMDHQAMPTAPFYRLWVRGRQDPSTPAFWDLHENPQDKRHYITAALGTEMGNGLSPPSAKLLLGTGQALAWSPPARSLCKGNGFREQVSLGAARCTHLEPRVSVALPDLLQQLPTGLAHEASSLQEILARLQGMRQNQHWAREQALKPHPMVPLGFHPPLSPTAPPAPHLSASRLCRFQQVRDSAGQVLCCLQKLPPIPSLILHQRGQQLHALGHLRQVRRDGGDSAAHGGVVCVRWIPCTRRRQVRMGHASSDALRASPCLSPLWFSFLGVGGETLWLLSLKGSRIS